MADDAERCAAAQGSVACYKIKDEAVCFAIYRSGGSNQVVEDRFIYQSEKLSQARSSLMAPHIRGEEHSFAAAFDFCSRAFHDFDVTRVEDEDAVGWIETIKRLMDTSDVEDPTGEGTWVHRARLMTFEEKHEFSNAVDELASWFDREFWSDS